MYAHTYVCTYVRMYVCTSYCNLLLQVLQLLLMHFDQVCLPLG